MHSPLVVGFGIDNSSASGPVNMLKLVRRRADAAVLLAAGDGPAARSAVAPRDEPVAGAVRFAGVAAAWVAGEPGSELVAAPIEGCQLGSANSNF